MGLYLKLLHESNAEKRNAAWKRTRPSVQEESGIIFEIAAWKRTHPSVQEESRIIFEIVP